MRKHQLALMTQIMRVQQMMMVRRGGLKWTKMAKKVMMMIVAMEVITQYISKVVWTVNMLPD
jgi:hypothetical protein